MDDTDSYHIQMIKWIQEYGSVPGIANLHLRFGFNSSWFVSIGLFSYPVEGLNSYIILNGVLSIWISYFFLEKIFLFSFSGENGNSKNKALASGLIFLLCLINWPLIRGSACNSNYDFITTCCIIILFIDLDGREKEISLEWFIWPAFLFTVRMMNFPLLVLSGIYFISRFKQLSWSKWIFIFSTGFIIIIPFLIRNAILSGYPFFPVYQLDFIAPDWKVDKSQLVEMSHYIKYFNRVNPMFQPMAVTEKLGFPNWIWNWYNYLFRYDKSMVTLSVLGYTFLLFRLKKVRDNMTRIFVLGMIMLLISWFFIAPDPRFAGGPLLFGIFAAILYLPPIKGKISTMMGYVLPLTCLFVFAYGISKMVRENEYRNFLTPHRLPVPEVQTVRVNHIQLYIPDKVLNNWNPRCYDIALPCLYRVDPRLETRGDHITEGFRLKNINGNIPGEYKITD